MITELITCERRVPNTGPDLVQPELRGKTNEPHDTAELAKSAMPDRPGYPQLLFPA
jgi:hypothetical protein